ncbi:MAG: serine O-acetyltransferase [Candidatus Thermoplasmatota archaeon]|nr:serine O-acetyltransferase [Candidatus Thermoplasmatota archaeon]
MFELIRGYMLLREGRKEWIERALKAIKENDPAAQDDSLNKKYPGFKALYHHRVTHMLWNAGHRRWARKRSERWRHKTGIEIHPGARIEKGVFIDHGMGVVIGETAELGEGCVLYQGVTLGGTGKEKQKRHPTLGKNVVAGAGAKILGNINIGDNVKIGAGSVVVKDVPPNCTVVGVPGRIVKGVEPNNNREKLPDPLVETLVDMQRRIEELERVIKETDEENKGGKT